jgi:hypothetical protein
MDLYVYYKVSDEHAAALLPRVQAMQAALTVRHRVAGQLKRRPQAKDGLQTWMEVYPAVAGDFEAALGEAAREADLAALAGPRHTEVFMDLMTCA